MIQNIATISVIYIKFFTNDIKKNLTYFFLYKKINWDAAVCVGRLNAVFSCRMNLRCLVWVPVIRCLWTWLFLMWLLWNGLWWFRYYLAGLKFVNGVWEKCWKTVFILFCWFILLIRSWFLFVHCFCSLC